MARIYSGPRILLTTNALTTDEARRALEIAEIVKKEAPGTARPRGQKAAVIGFSRGARLNLARQLALMDAAETPFHLCLTYGRKLPKSNQDLAREKCAMAMAVRRFGMFGFWRQEFQRPRVEVFTEWNDGIPHFHLLVFGDENQAARVGRWWRRHTKNAAEEAVTIRAGDEAKAMWYLALHAMKMNQSPTVPAGRWWGFIDRDRVKRNQRFELAAQAVTDRGVIWLKRLMRRKTRRYSSKLGKRIGKRGSLGVQGFTWFLREQDHGRVLKCVGRILDAEREAEGFTGGPF